MNDYTTILEVVHGSHAQGLATETSDVDVKGIIVGPRSWYFGFKDSPEQVEPNDDQDCVLFELRKFFRLAAAANPTALEVLWVSEKHIRRASYEGRALRGCRNSFMSLKIADTFGGYAMSQFRRIKTHRQWLLTPPTAQPKRSDFGLPERTVIPRDQLGAAEALMRDGAIGEAELTPNFLAIMERERNYRAAAKQWKQHEQWKRERNPVRAALEAKYGYDTKHALHLIRLLRMGREALTAGAITVERPDRAYLLSIRRGEMSYDRLIAEAEDEHAAMREAVNGSPLPEEPDTEALNELCRALVQSILFNRRVL